MDIPARDLSPLAPASSAAEATVAPPEVITVLVAGSQCLIRAGIARAIERAEGLELAGEAATPGDARRRIRGLRPEVVVIEASMHASDDGEALRTVRREGVEPRVLLVQGCATAGPLGDAVTKGADGLGEHAALLVDGDSCEDLAREIVALVRGDDLTRGKRNLERAKAYASMRDSLLSEQQHIILVRAAEGEKLEDTARDLGISGSAAKESMRSVRRALDAKTSTQAAVKAVEMGVIRRPPSG